MGKQTVLYPYNEMLTNNKKEWTIDTGNNMDEFQNKYVKWKKSDKNKTKHFIGWFG